MNEDLGAFGALPDEVGDLGAFGALPDDLRRGAIDRSGGPLPPPPKKRVQFQPIRPANPAPGFLDRVGQAESDLYDASRKEGIDLNSPNKFALGTVDAAASGLAKFGSTMLSGVAGVEAGTLGKLLGLPGGFTGNFEKAFEHTQQPFQPPEGGGQPRIPLEPEAPTGKEQLALAEQIFGIPHALGETAFEASGSPALGGGVEAAGNIAALLLGGGKRDAPVGTFTHGGEPEFTSRVVPPAPAQVPAAPPPIAPLQVPEGVSTTTSEGPVEVAAPIAPEAQPVLRPLSEVVAPAPPLVAAPASPLPTAADMAQAQRDLARAPKLERRATPEVLRAREDPKAAFELAERQRASEVEAQTQSLFDSLPEEPKPPTLGETIESGLPAPEVQSPMQGAFAEALKRPDANISQPLPRQPPARLLPTTPKVVGEEAAPIPPKAEPLPLEEPTNAPTQARQQQGDDFEQHLGDGQVRPPAEAGDRGELLERPPGQAPKPFSNEALDQGIAEAEKAPEVQPNSVGGERVPTSAGGKSGGRARLSSLDDEFESLKEQWQKLRGGSVGALGGEHADILTKLVQNRVEAGIRKFPDVARDIARGLGEHVDDIIDHIREAWESVRKTVPGLGPAEGEVKGEPGPIFYSSLERAIDNLPNAKAPPAQWLGTLKNLQGVTEEELAATGVREWLGEQRGSVTKEALLDHVKENATELTEKVKGDDGFSQEVLEDKLIEAGYQPMYDEQGRLDYLRDRNDDHFQPDELPPEVRQLIGRLDNENGADYPSMRLPGGKNYRELLLKYKHPEGAPKFTEYHFHPPEEDVLAHVRFDEHVDAEGRRSLNIAEIQSKLHAKGAKEGYAKPIPKGKSYEEEGARHAALVARIGELIELRGETKYKSPEWNQLTEELENLKASRDESHARVMEALRRSGASRGVPDVPFKKSHTLLAAKRMLRWAAEHGFDQVTFPSTPEQVASIEHWGRLREEDGRYFTGDHDVTSIIKQYTEELPRELGKYVEKWGGRVETTNLGKEGRYDLRDEVHAVQITPAMRESILSGQPKFGGKPRREQVLDVEYTKLKDNFKEFLKAHNQGGTLYSSLGPTGPHAFKGLEILTKILANRVERGARSFAEAAKQVYQKFPGLKDTPEVLERAWARLRQTKPELPEAEGDATLVAPQRSETARVREELQLPEAAPREGTTDAHEREAAIKEKLPEKAEGIAHRALVGGTPLSRREVAGVREKLAQHIVEHRRQTKALLETHDPLRVKDIDTELRRIEGHADLLARSLEQTGSISGSTLQAMRMGLKDNFEPVLVKGRAKAAKGSDLTDEEGAFFDSRTRQIGKLEDSISADREARRVQKANTVLREATKARTPAVLRKDYDALVKRARELIKSGCK